MTWKPKLRHESSMNTGTIRFIFDVCPKSARLKFQGKKYSPQPCLHHHQKSFKNHFISLPSLRGWVLHIKEKPRSYSIRSEQLGITMLSKDLKRAIYELWYQDGPNSTGVTAITLKRKLKRLVESKLHSSNLILMFAKFRAVASIPCSIVIRHISILNLTIAENTEWVSVCT